MCVLRCRVESAGSAPSAGSSGFGFDFVCLRPFRDGNGRISRLLMLLCLYQHGFEIGRCISLERFIEDSRDDYYEALRKSCEGWRDSEHDLIPWLNYFFGVLRRAYHEFERRVCDASRCDDSFGRNCRRRSPRGIHSRRTGANLPGCEPRDGSLCATRA